MHKQARKFDLNSLSEDRAYLLFLLTPVVGFQLDNLVVDFSGLGKDLVLVLVEDVSFPPLPLKQHFVLALQGGNLVLKPQRLYFYSVHVSGQSESHQTAFVPK